jgi:hypothetical protein
MKFEKMVSKLDQQTLEELRQSVAAEIAARRPSVQLSDIHPQMTAEQKQTAMREIARVLRGEE